jgi:hypothetical protein
MNAPLQVLAIAEDPSVARRIQAAVASVGIRTVVQIAPLPLPLPEPDVAGQPGTGAIRRALPRPDLVLLALHHENAWVVEQLLRARLWESGSTEVPLLVMVDHPSEDGRARIRQAGASWVWPTPTQPAGFIALARLLDRCSDQTPHARLRILRDGR